MLACCPGAEQLLEKLIRGGADVNKAASGGVTPLHVAAERGNTAAVQSLLKVCFYSCFASHGSFCLISPYYCVGDLYLFLVCIETVCITVIGHVHRQERILMRRSRREHDQLIRQPAPRRRQL